jgi:hypothetical protein
MDDDLPRSHISVAGAGPGPPGGAAGSTAGTWWQVAVAPFWALVLPVSRFAIIQIGSNGACPRDHGAKLGSMPSVRLRNFSVDSDEHLELLRRLRSPCWTAARPRATSLRSWHASSSGVLTQAPPAGRCSPGSRPSSNRNARESASDRQIWRVKPDDPTWRCSPSQARWTGTSGMRHVSSGLRRSGTPAPSIGRAP